MMTLKEVIEHCLEKSLSCNNQECALEHFQLFKWLQDYELRLNKQGEQKPYGQKRQECADCQFNYAGECEGSCAMKRSEQKHTNWSEEDEQHRKWILEYLYDGLRRSDKRFTDQFKSAIAWLNNLK